MRFGLWLEAGRIAAARHDSVYFRATPVSVALTSLSAVKAAPSESRDLLHRLEGALDAAPAVWIDAEHILNDLLRRMGST